MAILKLYHGSQNIVQEPLFGYGKNYNDYGSGFYCTENLELAKEWACPVMNDGFANCYELNDRGLKVLNLSKDYSALEWLTLLIKNRRFSVDTPLMKSAMEYLEKNFFIETAQYDVIKGWRADDSYFSFARAFLSNQISYTQLCSAMKLGNLGEQVVLKSKKAFNRIKFISYEKAECQIYFSRRQFRDGTARESFFDLQKEMDLSGLFMRDIVLQELKRDDMRLQ